MDEDVIFHVDRPENRIESVISPVDGWFVLREQPASAALLFNERPIPFWNVSRPDVERAYAGKFCQGFCCIVDLSQYVADRRAALDAFALNLVVDGLTVAQTEVRVNPALKGKAELCSRARHAKKRWLERYIFCPECRQPGTLRRKPNEVVCEGCGAQYPQSAMALNLLPPSAGTPREPSGNVSLLGYDEVALSIISDVRQRGGKVLDCGGGVRSEVNETVICSAPSDFPSIDVIADDQKLPFQDAVFDAILSLNVLEHVTDPFQSAAELIRVLKPGGKLYCCVPFLQPEHDYPHHYYNMTRSGLMRLFEGKLNIERHFVPASGQPIFTLHWFLSWYTQKLPESARNRLLELKVSEILQVRPETWLADPIVAELSEEGRWCLASTTAAILEKPAAGA
jgi:SAM-dependent methyltransferase